MTLWASLSYSALAVLAALALSGCVPSAQSQADEEREPHYMAGKNRASTLDYKGAIESFEKAIEVNPHSSAAHFELACLFDQKESDPAAAIYHYESYLKLRPEAGNADVVKQRIMTCKQELARNVSLGPLTERQQRELEQQVEENKKLSDQIKRLNEELDKWRAYGARLPGATNQAAPALSPTRFATATPALSGTGTDAVVANSRSVSAVTGPTNRTHTVKAGETLSVIARKYGVKVDALQTANPRVDPRKLQVGQSLSIPAS
jgi:LysM repeat protein